MFDFISNATASEGGDGWGYVVSTRWRELANQFERFVNKSDYCYKKRTNYDDYVIFAPEEDLAQECIIFTSNRKIVQCPDVIVEY